MYDHLTFRLQDEFIDQYKRRKVPWGFPCGANNTLGELTNLTKYSRVKEDGSKERWYEECRRVTEGTFSILRNHCEQNRTPWYYPKAQRAAEDFYDRLFNFKWTPPGRGLWMMGSEFVMQEGSAALQNCFGAEVEFITRDGIRRLGEVAGQQVEVWTERGWEKAEVKSFGMRRLQMILFSPTGLRSNVRMPVVVTPDHRWVLRDGSVTTDLKVGDVVPAQAVADEAVMGEGFKHGLIFGDGSINYTYIDGDFSHMMRLCGEKSKYADLFDVVHYQPNCDGDPVVYHRSSINMKALPRTTDPSYVADFILGWIATDGSKNKSGSVVVATQNIEAARWLVNNAAIGGWIVTGFNFDSTTATNFGDRTALLARITLARPAEHYWTVRAIQEMDEEEEAFCAVVPGTGTFTLASGILTGNCAFVSTEHLGVRNPTLPFIRLMEMSMLGIGVGFDTLGAGKLSIHKPTDEMEVYVIPDSREGWVEATEKVLRSFLLPNQPTVILDYSKVRPAGMPIKRFGGVAAGPGPLRRLHESIVRLFIGRADTMLTSTDIVDIQNLIGKCVVAGNVRRSAELALGLSDDKEFLNLKNFETNPDRMGNDGWGFLSNNSVVAEVGGDYEHLVDLIANNGEPGLIYLDLARQYGRLIDPPNHRDYRAAGVNPCAEQTLEDQECCTLVETFPFRHESIEDFQRTLKWAYLYAKAVTLLPTHWPETNEVMQRNRRIGASVSGIAQFAETYGWTELRTWLDAGYAEISRRDTQYSEWLGVRESIKKTSVKPSGTVSLLTGATPGVHWPEQDIYIRRQRFRNNDPMVEAFEQAGYHTEADVMDPDHTTVVEFPTLGPDVRPNRSVSVWEKVSLAAVLQKHWADNQVSATFTFREDERDQIGPLLRSFDGQLKSMSFLPMSEEGAYAQMPYERITRDEYETMTAKVQPIDFKPLYENGVAPEGEAFCTNDVCELPRSV